MDNAMQKRAERPLSPCVLICTLDDDQRCMGCGRSLDQIRRWSTMSGVEQWAVIDELAVREQQNKATIAPDSGD